MLKFAFTCSATPGRAQRVHRGPCLGRVPSPREPFPYQRTASQARGAAQPRGVPSVCIAGLTGQHLRAACLVLVTAAMLVAWAGGGNREAAPGRFWEGRFYLRV